VGCAKAVFIVSSKKILRFTHFCYRQYNTKGGNFKIIV
jgi:hypothetical protein